MLTAQQLFDASEPLTDADGLESHYLHNALRTKLHNYRTLSLSNLLEHKELTLPRYLLEYLSPKGKVICIAEEILGKVNSVVFRSITEKDFHVYGSPLFYGLGQLDYNFKFGTPILLTEGILDRDSLVDIYPHTLSVLTSGLSLLQQELISVLTDEVYLLYDADERGREGISRDYRLLTQRNIRCRVINNPIGYKDPGTLSELRFNQNTAQAIKNEVFYTQQIHSFLYEMKYEHSRKQLSSS